jgi:hypothetical protein
MEFGLENVAESLSKVARFIESNTQKAQWRMKLKN